MRWFTLLFGISAAIAQTFDAASVKPAPPAGAGPRGSGAQPWHEGVGHLRQPAISMRSLLTEAYGVRTFQIAGPAWMDTEHYAIDAVMAPSTTREQLRVMMQNLLAQRFQLKIHREIREQPV